MRAAVVRNPLSHRNRGAAGGGRTDVPVAEPDTPEALAADLKRFAADGVELLVIDGGDGTVREVASALAAAFGEHPPVLAVLPSGKTNILAFDLGVPRSWTLEALLTAAQRPVLKTRAPLELRRQGEDATLSGFLFGAAGFVRAKAVAEELHRAGVVNNSAVALALARGVTGAIGGGGHGAWRDGDPLSLSIDGAPARAGARFVTLATTLQRLPFAMRPFGPGGPGLKFLDVDAPPRGLAWTLPGLLWGRDESGLADRGYRRGAAARLEISLPTPFVLDGEVYSGGDLTLSEGPPLRFLTP